MADEETTPEEKGEKEPKEEMVETPNGPVKKDSVKAYFQDRGLDPGVHKNTFSAKDALATFAKAKDILEDEKANKKLVQDILNRAWDIFKILA